MSCMSGLKAILLRLYFNLLNTPIFLAVLLTIISTWHCPLELNFTCFIDESFSEISKEYVQTRYMYLR